MPSNYRGTDRYKRMNAARRVKRAGGKPAPKPVTGSQAPKSGLGYASILRPSGKWWDDRRKQVILRDRGKPCIYCGEIMWPGGKNAIDHLVPLSLFDHLKIPTNSPQCPGNSLLNLAYVHSACNTYRGSIEDIQSARRRIAARLEREVYTGPIPDLSEIRAALERLAREPVDQVNEEEPGEREW